MTQNSPDSKTVVFEHAAAGTAAVPIPDTIRAWVRVISGSEEGRSFELTSARTVLGRGNDCDVQVDDDSMSRRHLEITYRPLEFRLRDLDSMNGTYLNGSEVQEYALHNGDKIMAGETLMVFHVQHG